MLHYYRRSGGGRRLRSFSRLAAYLQYVPVMRRTKEANGEQGEAPLVKHSNVTCVTPLSPASLPCYLHDSPVTCVTPLSHASLPCSLHHSRYPHDSPFTRMSPLLPASLPCYPCHSPFTRVTPLLPASLPCHPHHVVPLSFHLGSTFTWPHTPGGVKHLQHDARPWLEPLPGAQGVLHIAAWPAFVQLAMTWDTHPFIASSQLALELGTTVLPI